jgi:hypothetical protein
MNACRRQEWGFLSYRALVALGKSATNCKFINLYGFEQMERLVLLIPTHQSQTVSIHIQGTGRIIEELQNESEIF